MICVDLHDRTSLLPVMTQQYDTFNIKIFLQPAYIAQQRFYEESQISEHVCRLCIGNRWRKG
jgi:hypothetical protein